MKKRIIKLLSIVALTSALFTVTASANESRWLPNTIFYSNPLVVYANSAQWDKRYDTANSNYYWVCATPDFHQGYSNAWICTNGKWYYVDNLGRMLKSTLVGDKYQKARYLLDENGVMETNTYWNEFDSTNYIDNNGLVHLPDKYYDMMPTPDGQSKLVNVPNVEGSYLETAKNMLNKYNFNYSINFYKTKDQNQNNKVLKQSESGKLQEHSTITLTVGEWVK